MLKSYFNILTVYECEMRSCTMNDMPSIFRPTTYASQRQETQELR